LTDPEFDRYFKRERETTSFLEINDSPKSPVSLLWETWKVVLHRKNYIMFSIGQRKSPTGRKK